MFGEQTFAQLRTGLRLVSRVSKWAQKEEEAMIERRRSRG